MKEARSMIFKRNVPGWERGLRAACGIVLLVVAAMMPLAGWPLWAVLAGGAGLAGLGAGGLLPGLRARPDGGSRERPRPHRRRAGGGREGRRRGGTRPTACRLAARPDALRPPHLRQRRGCRGRGPGRASGSSIAASARCVSSPPSRAGCSASSSASAAACSACSDTPCRWRMPSRRHCASSRCRATSGATSAP